MVKPSFIKSLNTEENYKLTIKERFIEFIYYNTFFTFTRKLGRFISRLFRWVPVLWDQEEWDYEYIYDLLKVKMLELRKELEGDTWHEQKCVQKCIKQINICLMRLDRWRNWTEYYEYPIDDIIHVPTGHGGYTMEYTSEENEKQRLGATDFKQHNYDKFWKDFLAWHENWWT